MSQAILVTGGTGNLGGLVVPRLRAAGAEVRVLSRGAGEGAVTGDLNTGQGLPEALAGIGTIVHCAGAAKGDQERARVLAGAALQAGAGHIVNISVVGADRVPQDGRLDRMFFGYFGMKLAAERVIAESGLPWTTLRASQFYELILTVAKGMARLPVLPAPDGVRFQPIDAADVADRMAELALGAPAGLVPDMAGPKIYPLADLVRSYLGAVGKRRPVVSLPLPGKAAKAIRAGANLAPEHATGKRTWEEFLAATVA